jgi:hypothetical protein
MRAGHTYQVIGNRQMLVAGGNDQFQAHWSNIKDPWPNALDLFDLTDLRRKSEYNATAAAYVAPSPSQQHCAQR